jgi:hypothetical protein
MAAHQGGWHEGRRFAQAKADRADRTCNGYSSYFQLWFGWICRDMGDAL